MPFRYSYGMFKRMTRTFGSLLAATVLALSTATTDAMVAPMRPVGPDLPVMSSVAFDLPGLETVSDYDAFILVDESGCLWFAIRASPETHNRAIFYVQSPLGLFKEGSEEYKRFYELIEVMKGLKLGQTDVGKALIGRLIEMERRDDKVGEERKKQTSLMGNGLFKNLRILEEKEGQHLGVRFVDMSALIYGEGTVNADLAKNKIFDRTPAMYIMGADVILLDISLLKSGSGDEAWFSMFSSLSKLGHEGTHALQWSQDWKRPIVRNMEDEAHIVEEVIKQELREHKPLTDKWALPSRREIISDVDDKYQSRRLTIEEYRPFALKGFDAVEALAEKLYNEPYAIQGRYMRANAPYETWPEWAGKRIGPSVRPPRYSLEVITGQKWR